MKVKNENIKSIFINIVSSIIFQIIMLVLSSSGLFYTLRNVFKSLQDNRFSISVLNFIILNLSSIFITIASILLIISVRKMLNKKKSYILKDITDYYFTDYEKHITIYKNGNGIIIHKFKVIANDVDKLQKIRRKLNIEDGNKTSKFPSLATMMNTNKSDRFNEYGFWYKSEDDIISDVKEYYWDSKHLNENKKIKKNPQEIRWIFKINKKKIKKKKPYEICYVISVPGLAALQNGNLNKEWQNDILEEDSCSNMHIDHKIQNLKYIISFEDGVCLDTIPKCKCIISEQDGIKELDIYGTEDYDLLYKKFIFNIDNPPFGSIINISWKYNII